MWFDVHGDEFSAKALLYKNRNTKSLIETAGEKSRLPAVAYLARIGRL